MASSGSRVELRHVKFCSVKSSQGSRVVSSFVVVSYFGLGQVLAVGLSQVKLRHVQSSQV